jgi:NUDIX domain
LKYTYIETLIKNAKREVLVFGVAGISEIIEAAVTQLVNSESDLRIRIFCESDNYLFNKSLLLDNQQSIKRLTYSDLLHEQRRISDLLCRATQAEHRVDIRISYIDLPIRIISIDGIIYTNVWITTPDDHYFRLDADHPDLPSVTEYIRLLTDQTVGLKFSAPYLHKDGSRIETIELYDEDRIRRGIFPRSAFYNSDFLKLVVWVFVFDRTGKMLIHKRATNAKDNQGMWDKSVGGHADYIRDTDTSKTVPREVVEELLTDENLNLGFLKPNDEDIIFLGDWRPEKRKDFPFVEINALPKSWIYFRLSEHYRTSSPRHLPSGTIQSNEVIADVYFLLLSENEGMRTLGSFENSKYKLIRPVELKTALDRAQQGVADPEFGEITPKFSPDLVFAFTSKLRQRLNEFHNYLIKTRRP